nr:GNAT family N-acetyltransferase [uncultured Sphaerochaeta sp.]
MLLTNKDIPAIRAYIAEEKEMNLFIEGDIEQYGLETETVSIWAFGEDWDCLLLRYYSNFIISSNKDQFDVQAVAYFLQDQEIQCISAKETILEQLAPYYPTLPFQGTYLCRLEKEHSKKIKTGTEDIRKLDSSHSQDIVDLYKLIEEFAKPYIEHEEEKLAQTRENYENGCEGYGIFKDDILVCTAYTTAKTSSGAMIIGVATHPAYRKRGYASMVMNHICEQGFKNGLSFLCLFYDNPAAGAIYHRIGFETIGRWAMMKF